MSFSAVLGLVSGIGSLVMGAQQMSIAQQELQLKREALEDQRNMAMLNYGLGLDQLRREREQERYLRDINAQNAETIAQEIARTRAEYDARKNQAFAERQYQIERQIELDRAAAAQRAFQIEQYLENQNLAQEERDYAISLLEDSRAVAQGERDEDLRRYAQERLMAQIEREFAIEQLEQARTTAASERAYDMQFRDNIMSRLSDLSGMLDARLTELGPLALPDTITPEEIASTVAMFENNAIQNVDRAADRVASINEADLIRNGIDNSTTGTARRADITARLAQEYDNARLRARQQAIAYITGQQDLLDQDFASQVEGRSAILDEIRGIYGPEIEAMLQMPALRSANDYSAPVAVNSGIFVRDVNSANDFSAPLAVNSGMVNLPNIGFGMADTLNVQSVADTLLGPQMSAVQSPQMWQISSPSGYFSNAASLQSGIASQYNPAPYFQNGLDYMSAGMSDIGWGLSQFGGFGQAGIGGSARDPGVDPIGAMPGWNQFQSTFRPTVPGFAYAGNGG